MKSIYFIAIHSVLFFIPLVSNSQKLSIDFNTGISLPVVSDYGIFYTSKDDGTNESLDYNAKRFGFSKGINLGLNLNYEINDGLSLQLGSHFLNGSSYDYFTTDEYTSGNFRDLGTEISVWNYQYIVIHSGLSFFTPINDRFTLYVTAGPMFNLMSKITSMQENRYEEFENDVLQDSYVTHEFSEAKSDLRLGIYTDLGLNWRMNDKLELFFVGSMRSYPQSIKSLRVTEYTVNDVDELPNQTTASIETHFVDSYNTNEENYAVANKELKNSVSNAGIGFNIGIRYLFKGSLEEASAEISEFPSRFYLAATVGYGFNFNGDYFESTKSITGNTEYTATPFSFGSGLNYQLRTGFRLVNELSLETGIMYHSGKASYFNESDYSTPSFVTRSSSDHNFSASMLRLPLGIKMERSKSKIVAYVRTGVLFSLQSKLKEEIISANTYGPTIFTITDLTEITYEYSGRFSLGVYGSLGITYKINDAFGIFTEADFITQNWAPEKSLVTAYKENGTDLLSTLTVNDKETHYVDEVYLDQNTPSGPDQPELEILQNQPFSSCVISIGFHWNIGGGGKAKESVE